MSKLQTLSIDLIRIDGGTQARVETHEDTVDDYVEVLEQAEGDWPFAPIDVFQDGNDYFAADGFHRILAAVRLKRASVPCRIHKGTPKDAKIFGMTANDRHGLRMTRADKRACVLWLLDQGGMTQEEIAAKAGTSRRMVQLIVASQKAQIAPSVSKTQGKSSGMKTGKPAESEYIFTGDDKPDIETETDETSDDESVVTSGESEEVPFEAAPEKPAPAAKAEEKPEKTEKIDKPEKPIPGKDPGEQERNLRKMFADHLARAVRLADLLHDMLPNARARDSIIATLGEVRLWTTR